MIISDARREANRRNARKSTGPVTDEGKAAVRRNAVKHGLTASLVVDLDLDLDGNVPAAGRAAGFARVLEPRNDWQAWVVEAIALVTTRLDRAARLERQVRAEASWRASTLWAEDRHHAAEQLGARLGRNPSRVVAELRRTPEGIDWLIGRWAMLASRTNINWSWTPEQARLAFDLLGTPAELRQGRPNDLIDAEGRPTLDRLTAEDLARAQIAELEALRARVVEADEIARALVEAGQADFHDAGLGRLRRYERELQSRLRWLVEQFHAGAPGAAAAPVPATARPAVAIAAPPAETKPPAPAGPPAETKPPAPRPIVAAPSPPAGAAPAPADAPRSDPSRRRPDLEKLLARSRG